MVFEEKKMGEVEISKILNNIKSAVKRGHVEIFKNSIKAMHQIQDKTLLCFVYNKTDVDLISLICEYNRKKFLNYLLHQSHILHYLASDTKCKEMKSKDNAFYYAMCSNNFEILEMLYDYWCGDLHWVGHKKEYKKFDVENLQLLKNLLTNAFNKYEERIKEQKRLDQLMLFNIQSLMTFNDFQISIYNKLNELKNGLNVWYDKPKDTRIQETDAIKKLIVVILETYEEQKVENVIESSVFEYPDECIEMMTDTSPLMWKTYFYLRYEVYFRKLDYNICLLILDNLHLLKLRLSMSKDSYQKLENKLYLFMYHVTSKWRLYLPKKKKIVTHNVLGVYKNISCVFTTKYDTNKVLKGYPNIYLERREFEKALNSFKKELNSINIREHIRNDKFKLPHEEHNSLTLLPELRDYYSLQRISQHIAQLYSVDVKNENEYAFLLIQRTLQIVGEYLKSSDESLHLKFSTDALVKAEISVEVVNDLKLLRNILCHVDNGELLKRIELEINKSDIFEIIRKELLYIKKKIDVVIKIYKPFTEKALLKNAIALIHSRKNEIPQIVHEFKLVMLRLLQLALLDFNRFCKDISTPLNYFTSLMEEGFTLFIQFIDLDSKLAKVNKNIRNNVILKFPFYREAIKYSLKVITDSKKKWKQFVDVIKAKNSSITLFDYPNEDDCNRIISYSKKYKLDKSLEKLAEDKALFTNIKCNWWFILNLLQHIVLETCIFDDNIDKLKVFLVGLHKLIKYEYLVNDTDNIVEEYLNKIDTELNTIRSMGTFLPNPDFRGIKELKLKLTMVNFLTEVEKTYLIETLKSSEKEDNDKIEEMINKIKKDVAIPRSTYSNFIRSVKLNNKAQTMLNNLVMGYKRDPLLLHTLKKRVSLLKEIIDSNSQSQMILRYKMDKTFRALVEVLLCDIFAILNSYTSNEIVKKSGKLLTEINLRNILSHGNPLLEVVGSFLDSNDLSTELVTKALDVLKDEGAISSLCTLIDNGFDIKKLNCSETLNSQEKALVMEFKNSTRHEDYLLLIPEYRLYIECKQKKEKKKNYEETDEATLNLLIAVKKKNHLLLQKSISENAKVNYVDRHGKAVIHYAAMNGDIGVLEELLNNGAHVNIRDEKSANVTALHYSAMNGLKDTVVYLLDNGADCTAMDDMGRIPIYYSNLRNHVNISQLLERSLRIAIESKKKN